MIVQVPDVPQCLNVISHQQCLKALNVHISAPEHWECTYHRQKGIADAESWLRGKILIRSEADPDLTAFGSVTSRDGLWPAPASQDGLLSHVLHLHKVVPGEMRQDEIITVSLRHRWLFGPLWDCVSLIWKCFYYTRIQLLSLCEF